MLLGALGWLKAKDKEEKEERRFQRQLLGRAALSRVSNARRNKAQARPEIKGRVLCHIVDTNASCSLVPQLKFLSGRRVQTFFIHTDRPDEVRAFVEQALDSSVSVHIIDRNTRPHRPLWRVIDRINMLGVPDCWCLILRSGELLTYPFFEERTIPDLCQFLINEHRRSYFALRLDVYSESRERRGLEFGADGWRIDSHGYDFDYNGTVKSDLWRGGFAYRYPELMDRMGGGHISRVPLFALTGFTVPTGDLLFALPRRLNTANSQHHLSATGCILSDRAFQLWFDDASANTESSFEEKQQKLLSAPGVQIGWTSADFHDAGLMNYGQWF